MIVFLAILLLLLLFFWAGIYFSNKAIYPRTRSHDDTYNSEVSSGRLDENSFKQWEKQEVFIRSPFGYNLYGLYFPSQGSNKAVILCHGITYTLYGSVKYMSMFLNRGFNVLIYDHRNHGRSGGKNTTFGFYEKYDLKACTDWVLEKCGPGAVVGIHGESMGGAVVLQNTAIDERISFCIADCPYSDLTELLKIRIKADFHLPFFPLLYIADLFTKLRTGMSFRNISPIRDITDVKIPVFFIHGQNDAYIPKEMSIAMYNAKKGGKKLYIAPNADHAESCWKNNEEYDRHVGEFLDDAGII